MYQNINDPEIFLEAVSHKLHTLLKQVEQLEVAGLQGGEMLGAYHGIQVSRFDPREFSEVVHHLGEGEGEGEGEGGGGRRRKEREWRKGGWERGDESYCLQIKVKLVQPVLRWQCSHQ